MIPNGNVDYAKKKRGTPEGKYVHKYQRHFAHFEIFQT